VFRSPRRVLDPPLLQARDLAFAYGCRTVLHSVDLDVAPASCGVIRGDNGAGKSTLLHLLQGALQPSRGWVRLAGRPLPGQRRRVALVPQAAAVNWHYPIALGALVALGAQSQPRGTLPVLRQVALESLWERPISSLSAGQRQRALIARALAQRATVLLLDEPLACLDADSRLRFGSLIRVLVASGTTILLTAHGELPPTLPRFQTHVLRECTLFFQPVQPSVTPW
jgi:ABC-type Mn2+/Zn2+ transport system ATPase subunit